MQAYKSLPACRTPRMTVRSALVCEGTSTARSKPLVVIMGVSGCGKRYKKFNVLRCKVHTSNLQSNNNFSTDLHSTVGKLMAEQLQVPFYDGDDYHSIANKAKMAAGTPLTDEDRHPWLLRLALLLQDAASRGEGAVLACSALRRAYRELLSNGASKPGKPAAQIAFVLLDPSRQELEQRLQRRQETHSHFMPPSLLESQLAILEYDESELAWHAVPGPGDGLLPPPERIAGDAVRSLGCC